MTSIEFAELDHLEMALGIEIDVLLFYEFGEVACAEQPILVQAEV